MLNLIYQDKDILVCVKPSGALSTDEPGGMPDLLRETLGNAKAPVFSVHRLDRVVSGLMVYARSKESAAALSRQITDRGFEKEYMAVIHGCPKEPQARWDDLLFRDKSENKTYVVKRMRKGVRDAALEYKILAASEALSLVKIHLLTGRTHQIRAQFSSRQFPLYGDRKYGACQDKNEIALWSHSLRFQQPTTGEELFFSLLPPRRYPWNSFPEFCEEQDPNTLILPERRQFLRQVKQELKPEG